jgi:hypothetical protein
MEVMVLIHSGRQLKQLAADRKKVTTTQTAAQAVRAIINKFGSVNYHRAKDSVVVHGST